MATYGKKASDKVEKAMHEKKRGTLRSGSGKKVKCTDEACCRRHSSSNPAIRPSRTLSASGEGRTSSRRPPAGVNGTET